MEETFDKELVKKYPFPIATYYAKMQKEEKCMNKCRGCFKTRTCWSSSKRRCEDSESQTGLHQ